MPGEGLPDRRREGADVSPGSGECGVFLRMSGKFSVAEVRRVWGRGSGRRGWRGSWAGVQGLQEFPFQPHLCPLWSSSPKGPSLGSIAPPSLPSGDLPSLGFLVSVCVCACTCVYVLGVGVCVLSPLSRLAGLQRSFDGVIRKAPTRTSQARPALGAVSTGGRTGALRPRLETE